MNGVEEQGITAGPVPVPDERIREHAERLVTKPVARAGLSLGFSQSTAADVEVLVEGSSFYPRMLDDLAAATSSIHINQFGFRPGIIGESFAGALAAKAR
jgi:phosphatidylserine/phosphatidylglycerophosphate/cardiolipin synthase-like enzyme